MSVGAKTRKFRCAILLFCLTHHPGFIDVLCAQLAHHRVKMAHLDVLCLSIPARTPEEPTSYRTAPRRSLRLMSTRHSTSWRRLVRNSSISASEVEEHTIGLRMRQFHSSPVSVLVECMSHALRDPFRPRGVRTHPQTISGFLRASRGGSTQTFFVERTLVKRS